ncbi:MAG: DUF2971 domain-containing protein [Pseudobdellovibrionaceae bacterium]
MCRTPKEKEVIIKEQEEVIREIRSNKVGVFSLTANFKNILSWSHYTDSHRGFCVGFHTGNLNAFLEKCGPSLDLRAVDYTTEYPYVKAYRTSDVEKTKKILWTKANDWEYECEYRILWFDGANKPLKIPDGVIRRVILGCHVDSADKDEMMSILRACTDRISLFQAERKRAGFGLRFDYITYK